MARQTLRGDEGQYPDLSLVQLLRRLLAHLGRRRQRQLVEVFGLTLLGAIAEVMAIGAILPFLSLMASPEGAAGLPLIGGWIAGRGLAGRDLLLFAAAAFAGAALVAGAVRLLQAWASQKFILRLGHDIGVAIFQRVLRQPYLYHVSRNSSRFLADMERVSAVTMLIMLPLMMAASALVMTVFILLALMTIDPVVTLLAIL
ncbi:MAG TPA: ABC transporter ATP-binding protein, partial [Pseudomonadaceae bacterium]|nr:ABC transporter ATP-binding protein [Pseudomonadaceae bacterium]